MQPLLPRFTRKIADATFAVVDTETTGLYTYGKPSVWTALHVTDDGLDVALGTADSESGLHRVIEIAVVLFRANGGILERYSERINPQRPIPKSAQWVHGIGDADVADSPKATEVMPKAHAVMAKADMVFAFNSPFDMRFLIQEWLLCDLGVPDTALYDVARLARRAGLGTADLGSIASDLGVTQVGAHSALGDVETTAACLVKLLQMGFRGEETLQSVIAAHDLTVPVYGTARALPTVLHSYDKTFGIDPLHGPLNVPGKIPTSAQILDRKSRYEAAGRKLGKSKQPTDGVPVCITGALPGIPRKFITPRLAAVGYAYVKEVSYRVEFMVAGHKPTERKLDDARQIDLTIMSAEDFLRWLAARERAAGIVPEGQRTRST